jgi:hypothetical protein
MLWCAKKNALIFCGECARGEPGRGKLGESVLRGRKKGEGGERKAAGLPGLVLLGPAYYLRAEQAPRLNRV